MPRYRTSPEDFEVEELPLYAPDGDGPFLWLWLEKRGLDTAEVARRLAEACDLPRREVGWAGRKDRHAVTRQAFTLPERAEKRAGPELCRLDRCDVDFDGVTILDVRRTRQRLRAGELFGNRFRLVIRELAAGEAASASSRLDELAVSGLANRFGAQRYGKDGRNAERGRRVLESERVRGDRRRAFLMVSALQSKVFDEVSRRRPVDELWPGDLALLHASNDWRWVDDPADYTGALRRFEVSPTGPIFGTKVKRPRGRAAELEREVLAEFGLQHFEPPKGLRVFGDRRALRVQPKDTALAFDTDTDSCEVRFALPAGSYATVLLAELFPQLDEGPPRPESERRD